MIRPFYKLKWSYRLFYGFSKASIKIGWNIHFMVLWSVRFVHLFSHPFRRTVCYTIRPLYGLCYSSYLDDSSTLWTLFLILLGWSFHFTDLIRIVILLDDSSSLWTLVYTHPLFVDLEFSSSWDDPSSLLTLVVYTRPLLWTWNFHPFGMTRPIWGL